MAFVKLVVAVPSDMYARQTLTSRQTRCPFVGFMVVAPSDMCASQTLRLQATCALVRLSLLVRLFGNYVRRAASGFLECSQAFVQCVLPLLTLLTAFKLFSCHCQVHCRKPFRQPTGDCPFCQALATGCVAGYHVSGIRASADARAQAWFKTQTGTGTVRLPICPC